MSTLQFSHMRAIEVARFHELRLRITLDGNVQESMESALDAGVHAWREPFSFPANAVSLCEIHLLAKKRKFLCCTGRYKTIRTTRLCCIAELLDTRSTSGVVRLPLYDATRSDPNSAAMGSLLFAIADAPIQEEKRVWIDSVSDAPISPPPRPMAPTPPSPPLASPHVLTPQHPTAQRSGVDRFPADIPPPSLPHGTITAQSSLDSSHQGSAKTGNFTPVICEPPEDITSDGLEAWGSGPTESTSLATPLDGYGQSFDGTIPQISITLAKSSRGNSPLAPPSCDSDTTLKRPSVHVDTASATGVTSALSASPGFVDQLSPFPQSPPLPSPQPDDTSTSSGLSPFSCTSMVESPSTAVTTPAQSAISEVPNDPLTGAHTKQRKERPTIDTSCVGPRGQVRKYRNGSVPPVHVPVKLRNASLDLPRTHEYEKFEPNPSMYSIAPSISPQHYKKNGDLRCPSSQQPASRQGLAPSTRAPSIRREALEFDEGQICLDTANLGDQEVATFLKEVDAALSVIVNGSPAVAADSRAFLAVPSASSRLASRNQSRKPSSQHLRADLSATIRSHDKENAARTGFSLIATSHPSDAIPSRVASPLSGHADSVQRMFLSQANMPPGSTPGSPSRGTSSFPLQHRVSPQPSPRQELVEWASPSFVSSVSTRMGGNLQFSRPGSYHGDVSGNENTSEIFKLEIPPHAVRGRRA